MLEQLFGSKTRTQLLRTFLQNPETPFFVRELTRKLDVQINAVRHELRNLEALGLIEVVSGPGRGAVQKKHYRLNQGSVLCSELRALFIKSRVLLEKDFVKRLSGMGRISYFALTGRFVDRADSPTDLFIVGRVDRRRLTELVRRFEVEFSHEINFTVLDEEEMRYRMDVMDRFLYSVLDQPKLVFVDEFFDTATAKV
jgi:DNA-binding transcriptional ArsR family regulator